MDEKFEYEEDFGELLVGKKRPTIFVYDIPANSLKKVEGLPTDIYPQYPTFDQHSRGLVFSGVHLPVKKLGLTYFLNRPTALYYLAEPEFN